MRVGTSPQPEEDRLGFGAAMDSPEATKVPVSSSASVSSPPVKDSPFSSYASSLSPIQCSNSRQGLRVYRDLNFPSPEPVFTSPHITLPRKSDTVRSSLPLPLVGVEKFSVQDSNDRTTLPGNMLRSSASMAQLNPSNNEFEGNPTSKHETCGASSSCVDVFLSDPSDVCDNSSASPVCVSLDQEMHERIQGISTNSSENQIEPCREKFACLKSVTAPSASDLVDEFIADPVEHSGTPDLQSKQGAVVPQVVCNDSVCSQEMNTQIDVSLVEKSLPSQTTEYMISSSKAKDSFSGDEASFLVNISLDDGEDKIFDEANEAVEVSLHEQPASITNNSSIDCHSFEAEAGALDQQTKVNIVDQNNVSSVLNDKANNDISLAKTTIASYFCHNVRDARPQISAQGLGELNSTPQCLPESLQNAQAVGDLDVSREKVLLSADNQIPFDEDSTQHQRGMRKRLQFEAVEKQKTNAECSRFYTKFSCDISCAEPPQTSVDMDTSDSCHLESFEIPRMKKDCQAVSQSGPCKLIAKVDSSGQKKGGSFVPGPRPCGIGLHLNSIGNIGNNCCTVVQLLGKDSCMEDSSFLGDDDKLSQGSSSELASTGLIGKNPVTLTANFEKPIPHSVGEDTADKHLENHVMEPPLSSVSFQTPQSEKAIQCSMQSKLTDRYVTPCNLKRPLPVDDSKVNLSSQSSPRKKRRKAVDTESQKRCSCKRSKCLKLYCDCFAAGTFCSELCGCLQCVNKPENEDTIREAKQQIESRNPLAFAPKVVLCASDPPKDNEENMGKTPSSARHKRGCNCKKSLCLKKYCECYQAGVGCSFGCRCEGCKNTFGRRDGCIEIIEIEHKKSSEQSSERDSSAEKLGISEMKSRLTPLTPLIQVASGVDVAKSLVPCSYYTSPETSASALPYYEGSPGSPVNSINKCASIKDRDDALSIIPYDSELDFDIKVDTLSPGWDGFPDICNLSPLAITDGAPASSKTKEPKVLQTRLFQGNSLALGSLGWRCSPVTPLQQFGESKIVVEPDTGSGLNKNPEDDTPEILKETCLPMESVKTSSPKQKRISPPKRLMESRSSSSTIRNGRKFILQSVPSFPPLTPYSNNSRDRGTT
ncbi:hypothetical protein Cni_G05758 [Canna indica]|uniref:CRC domain-containing protein n=1 Tax=Canna indica TaxID=4628 RepID=A0AAQ3Q3H5_9LILI|nr:hypothetical protein Cni_G05758 [Canna indica]